MARRHRKFPYKTHDIYNTMEVSIVGGGLTKYKSDKIYNIAPGKFIYLRPFGEDHDLLVKFRAWSSAKTKHRVVAVRPVSKDTVINTMKNMARGLLWENGVQVKIVDAEMDFKVGKIEFFFVADSKLDLRKYGAMLAKLLHVRVKFTQIGARDMAVRMGGIGRCGRELCCTTFLKELPSVTLDMARNQYLFSAPEKLSGICGRLLCCLRFELPFYQEASQHLPQLGAMIETEKGLGRVVEVNAIKMYYRVRYEDDQEEVISVGQEGASVTEGQTTQVESFEGS